MKFNVKAASTKLLNYEGETAFALKPQMELYTLVATSCRRDWQRPLISSTNTSSPNITGIPR